MYELSEEALVLEVGSGSRPWERADVLLDRFYVDQSGQRGGTPIYRDRRPLVVASGERLPFKDKAFDFVYSCHVVEHAEDIGSMLQEMSRVARAGFIECPNPLLERILDQPQHKWYVTNVGGTLLIAPKNADSNVAKREDRFYFHLMSDHFLVRQHWSEFVTRLRWTGEIQFEICDDVRHVFDEQYIPPRFLADAQLDTRSVLCRAWMDALRGSSIKIAKRAPGSAYLKRARDVVRSWMRSRRKPRVSEELLLTLLACPYCRSDLRPEEHGYVCTRCPVTFRCTDGVAVLL